MRCFYQQSYTTLLTPNHATSRKFTISEAIKVSNVVTQGERLPIIKPDGDFKNRMCEGMWQIKNIKSDLSQYLLLPNFSGWLLTARRSHPYSRNHVSCDFVFLLCDLQESWRLLKAKSLWFQLHSSNPSSNISGISRNLEQKIFYRPSNS